MTVFTRGINFILIKEKYVGRCAKTKNKKLENKNKKQYIDLFHRVDQRNVENNLESIRHLIYFGRDILDYYSCHPH